MNVTDSSMYCIIYPETRFRVILDVSRGHGEMTYEVEGDVYILRHAQKSVSLLMFTIISLDLSCSATVYS